VLLVLGTALVLLGVALTVVLRPGADGAADDRVVDAASLQRSAPAVGHVFVINLENKSFRTTWGAGSAAPYLARTLRGQGVLLSQYFATAHHSLPDYVAQVSGQAPSRATQADCGQYAAFRTTGSAVAPQQAVGRGCVYPRSVKTIGNQLSAHGLGWRAYLEDMTRPCQHPRLGAADRWQRATASSQYATRHNPFVYFRSITSRAAYCKSHDVPLSELAGDLQKTSTTRALTYITPDLCHDAHDSTCADGGPGGLRAANAFLKHWVPVIRRSPAYQADGMLVITSDESEGSATACCGEVSGPNVAKPGLTGMGGGRVGALILAPGVAGGAVSTTPYNHYSLLATLEDVFGLPRLGYARRAPATFVPEVFTAR